MSPESAETAGAKRRERIAWIGAGVMGAPMAGHLIEDGYELDVFNRTRARASTLAEKGARWQDSPGDAAAAADVVCLMLGFPSDVRETVLCRGGVLERLRPGSLLIDMTTSEPSLAVEIHAAAREQHVQALDAPVSGGDVGARNATLVIMVGGERDAFDRALPLLSVLGAKITLQGGPGAGQHTKMMNQIAIASGMIGLCEALLYAHRAGLDVEQAIATIKDGAAGSWSLSKLRPARSARRLRAGLQDRPLHQGPRDRADGGTPDEPVAARDSPRRAAVRSRPGSRTRPAGNTCAVTRARAALERALAAGSEVDGRAGDVLRAVDSPQLDPAHQASCTCCSRSIGSAIGLHTSVGATALTRIPYGAQSIARLRVIAATAPLSPCRRPGAGARRSPSARRG